MVSCHISINQKYFSNLPCKNFLNFHFFLMRKVNFIHLVQIWTRNDVQLFCTIVLFFLPIFREVWTFWFTPRKLATTSTKLAKKWKVASRHLSSFFGDQVMWAFDEEVHFKYFTRFEPKSWWILGCVCHRISNKFLFVTHMWDKVQKHLKF